VGFYVWRLSPMEEVLFMGICILCSLDSLPEFALLKAFPRFWWSQQVDQLRFLLGKWVNQASAQQWHSLLTTHRCKFHNLNFQILVLVHGNIWSICKKRLVRLWSVVWHFRSHIALICEKKCRPKCSMVWCLYGRFLLREYKQLSGAASKSIF